MSEEPSIRRVEIDTARGQERVPPGQYLVGERWPVLTYGATPQPDLDNWTFSMDGLVENAFRVTWEEWLGFPQVEVVADMHCVTSWSRLDNVWSGVPAKHILDLAKPKPEATYFSAFCEGGYTTNLPVSELYEEDVLFATHHNGEPLSLDHGWPMRLVIPRLYAWKSAKWLRGLEFLSEDRSGFWEENGYHAYGDPWKEQRYSFSF